MLDDACPECPCSASLCLVLVLRPWSFNVLMSLLRMVLRNGCLTRFLMRYLAEIWWVLGVLLMVLLMMLIMVLMAENGRVLNGY